MKDPHKKMDILKGSLESGTINREEYKKEKEKLDPHVKKFDRQVEELNKEPSEEEPKKSDNPLLVTLVMIGLLFIGIIAYGIYTKDKPKTLEELHVLNLQGKLKPSQGYVYKGVYSFVKFENLWYTQLKSPKGSKVYSLALRYSPNELKDIVIEGQLNTQFFDNQSEFYVTFNPIGRDFSYVSLAVADFDTHMSKVFEKNPIAACDRNVTALCAARPIVTCDDKDKLVLYVKESDKARSYYKGNCIVVEGNGLDLVKGVDRILYNLYDIMGQAQE